MNESSECLKNKGVHYLNQHRIFPQHVSRQLENLQKKVPAGHSLIQMLTKRNTIQTKKIGNMDMDLYKIATKKLVWWFVKTS